MYIIPKTKIVWVELNDVAAPVRIFKNRKAAYAFGKEWIGAMLYTEAVAAIRQQLFLRAQEECELCASPITEKSGHMHEKIPRGKGGEISLENSVFICPPCHRRAHIARNPRFSKKPLDKV